MTRLTALPKLIAAASALVLSFAAAVQAEAPASVLERERAAVKELHAAAVAAGQTQLNLYPGILGFEPVAARFQQAFPDIRVNTQVLRAQSSAQIDGEFAAGRITVDIIEAGGHTYARYDEAGRLESWTPPAGIAVPEHVNHQGKSFAVYGDLKGAAWNASIDAKDVPKSYKEFFTGSWPEKVGFQRALGGGMVQSTFINLYAQKLLTEADIARFAEFKGDPAQANLIAGLGQGTYDILPLTTSGAILRAIQSGAPFTLGVIDDLSWLAWGRFSLIKGGPNPLAARLFLAWLLTHDGQQAVADQNFYSFHPAVKLQPGLPPLEAIKIREVGVEEQLKVSAEVQAIVRKYWK